MRKSRGATSLHSTIQFDIIRAALQMMDAHRSAGCVSSFIALLAILSCPRPSRAADDGGTDASAQQESADTGTTRKEIMHVLDEVRRKYGSDAVLMEGHLLRHAVRSGSILETVVSIPGIEEHNGRRFLAFKVETGIIYNDRDVSGATRVAHAWSDIVEATLRTFHTITVEADGIALLVGYGHKAYADEADLRAHLSDGHGDTESAAFYLLLSDVRELLAERISAQQLIDRSTVLVDGAATHLVLTGPTPAPDRPTSVDPLLQVR